MSYWNFEEIGNGKIMFYCVLFCQAAHHVLNLKLDILVIRKLQQICSKEKILF